MIRITIKIKKEKKKLPRLLPTEEGGQVKGENARPGARRSQGLFYGDKSAEVLTQPALGAEKK